MNIDSPVTIRRATEEHIPELIRLGSQSSTGAHWSGRQYQSLLMAENGVSTRLVLISEHSPSTDFRDQISPVVGFLIAHHVLGEWELENIVVASEARTKGIGTALMNDLLVRAKQSNSEAVFLEVRESNRAARGLYEKLGFTNEGRRKSYYSNPIEDAVLYRKGL